MILKLAFRLIRGGGVAGLLRMGLVVFGIALGITAGTMVAVMPGILDGRADVMNARSPSTPATEGRTNFVFSTSTDVWDGNRLGRTFLADVQPGTPLPIGVTALPKPGEIVASPRLAEELAHAPELAVLVPGRVVGTIGADGLIGPDEFFAYVGTQRDGLAEAHDGAAFGSRDELALAKQQAGLSQSLALLVLPPVAIYLMICGRLAAATRMRRYAALRLIGMRKGQVLRTAFVETAAAGLIGGFAGILLFQLVHPALAGSGWLGFTWYPGRAGLSAVFICLLALFVSLASGLLGVAGLRRGLSKPIEVRRDTSETRPHPFYLLPLAFGLGLTTFILIRMRQPAGAGERYAMGSETVWLAIGAVGLMVVGVLLGLKPIIAGVARTMNRPSFPLPVRMAGARLALQTTMTLRLLIGLALLVLVAGVSAGVLRDLELRSSPVGSSFSVDIDGTSAPAPQARQRLYDLPARFKWTVQSSVFPDDPASVSPDVKGQAAAGGYRVVSLSCAGLREMMREPFADCRDGGWYRLAAKSIAGTPYEVPAGASFEYDGGDGKRRTVTVPEQRLVVPDDSPFPVQAYGGLFHAKDGPVWNWTGDSTSSYLIDPDPQVLSDFKVAVAEISPATRVRVWGEDLDLLELSRNQGGVIHFGVVIGFLVAILAFGVATVDNAVERRRDVAGLMVLGFTKRTIRAVQVLQLLAALVIMLAVAGVSGHLAGNVALRLNDVNRPWYTGTLDAMLPFSAAAIVVAIAAGSFVAIRRLRSEDLKRE